MDTVQKARKCYQTVWLKYAVYLVAMEVSGLLLERYVFADYLDRDWIVYILTILTRYVIAFLILLLLIRKDPVSMPEKNKMGIGGLLAAFFIMSLFKFVGGLVGAPINSLVVAQTGGTTTGNDVIMGGALIWNIAVGVILAPIFEELIFRKTLIDHVGGYGEKAAVIASGLAFGLFHMNTEQIFYCACMGFVLAYVYVRTGNILYSIGLHMANNLLGVITAAMVGAGGVQELTLAAMAGDVSAGLKMLCVFLLSAGINLAGLVLFIIGWKKKWFRTKELPEQLPKGKGITAFVNIGFLAYFAVVLVDMLYHYIR